MSAAGRAPIVALAGNPNSGKTTLFNRLTGLNQSVGNYPGITVEKKIGTAELGGVSASIVDLPGTYSLISRSREEAVAFEVLTGRAHAMSPELVVVVVDASNLDRNLYLALQILELGRPVVIALNMIDAAEKLGLKVDAKALADRLGVPVVPIVAARGDGVDELRRVLASAVKAPSAPPPRPWRLDPEIERALADVTQRIPERRNGVAFPTRSEGEAIWLLATLAAAKDAATRGTDDDPLARSEHLAPAVEEAERALTRLGERLPRALIEARYETAGQMSHAAVEQVREVGATATDRIDAVLLHRVAGPLVLVGVTALVFQSIFSWAQPIMDAIEGGFGWLGGAARGALPAGALTDLLVEGVITGVGSVLVFIPQIAILFLFISVLEDTGYLARAAYIMDRIMARIGLHGRAFVPLISGFACAVPAIMAARTIESTKDRLVTIMVTPLMSCSARLPVYALVISALFASFPPLFGVISVGAVLLLLMYSLSVGATVTAAAVLKRTLLKSPTPPLVLELPPYRWPHPPSVIRRVAERCKVFLRDAGTVILACSIVLWGLLTYPRDPELPFNPTERRAAIEASVGQGDERQAALDALDAEIEAARLRQSYAGRLGHLIEPVIEPLGFDWKIGIGLVGSFAAREVLVSTLGLVYGIGRDADEGSVPLRQAIVEEKDPKTRAPIYTPLVGLSLMIFFLFACQCMSTLAIVRRETASWRWPALMFAYMTALAWLASFTVYQGGRLLGFG